MASYAISDIHGCINTFRELVENKINLSKTDILYCLGDFIDRGPSSKDVVDYIMDLMASGFIVKPLLGNHEDMLLRCLQEVKIQEMWYTNGGGATLDSFNIESVHKIEEKYLDFFQKLSRFEVLEDYLLVHAGFNFMKGNIFLDEESMLWTRSFEVDPEMTNQKIVLHGHTPEPLYNIIDGIEKSDRTFKINIDNGAYFKSGNDMGNLLAIRLEDRQLFVQANIDF